MSDIEEKYNIVLNTNTEFYYAKHIETSILLMQSDMLTMSWEQMIFQYRLKLNLDKFTAVFN